MTQFFSNGKYEKDNVYDLYIQSFTCIFKIKKNKIPTIQIKKDDRFSGNEYLESSNGETVFLCLTSVDLDLFLEHYDIQNEHWLSGYKFKSINGLFTDYVDKWTERKINAKKVGNYGIYMISKIMLNSLYGKFALNPKVTGKFPYLSDEEIVKYHCNNEEIRKGVYLPVRNFYNSLCKIQNDFNFSKNKRLFN